MKSVPVARGLILCDAVEADERTGKLTLVNCFNQIVGMNERPNPELPLAGTTTADGTLYFEIADTDAEPGDPTMTAAQLLRIMRKRVKVLGSPVPEGYVPPPGIDLDELLRQVPWPPAA